MKESNCEIFNLPPCLTCLDPTGLPSLDVCQIDFFSDMLLVYGNSEEDIEKYILKVIVNSGLIHGLRNAIYLRKAIEINCPEYLYIYKNICPSI